MSTIALGKRVYGVSKHGLIIPTLISQIHLNEEEEVEHPVVRAFSERLKGVKHAVSQTLSIKALNTKLSTLCLTFDEAYEEVLRVLSTLILDEGLRVSEQRELRERLEKYQLDKNAIQTDVDSQVTFLSQDYGLLLAQERDKEDLYQSSDFPRNYIKPGTAVWIADMEKWRLIHGMVTSVQFAPKWNRKIVYKCGGHSNLEVNKVFRTKTGAMNYLKKKFSATLPGTLEPKRVTILKQVSETEAKAQRYKEITKLTARLFPRVT